MSKIIFTESATPDTPSAGKAVLYFKTDGHLYKKDDAGTETQISGGGGGGVTDHGALTGLGDDDHTQYLNETRHDALPSDNPHSVTKAQVGLSNVPNVDATARANHTGTQTASTISDFLSAVQSNETTTSLSLSGSTLSYVDEDGVTTNIDLSGLGGGGGGGNPATKMELYEEFVTGTEDTDELGTYGWRTGASGSGSSIVRLNGVSGHPGIVRLNIGAANNSSVYINLGEPSFHSVFPAGGELVFETVLRWNFDTIADLDVLYFGLASGTNVGVPGAGIYFEPGATNWFLTASDGVTSSSDTGIAIADNAWTKFRWTLNAAATSVQASINGVDVGSAITTNIPSSAISPVFLGEGISGTVINTLDIDYFYMTQDLTR